MVDKPNSRLCYVFLASLSEIGKILSRFPMGLNTLARDWTQRFRVEKDKREKPAPFEV